MARWIMVIGVVLALVLWAAPGAQAADHHGGGHSSWHGGVHFGGGWGWGGYGYRPYYSYYQPYYVAPPAYYYYPPTYYYYSPPAYYPPPATYYVPSY